jgi:hypothetical protein
MGEEDEPIFEVIGGEGATPNNDGTLIKLSLLMKEGRLLHLAIPAGQLPPLVALMSQAAAQAYAIAGSVDDQQILEAEAAEVYLDQQSVVFLFRLSGGLDLPIALTPQSAKNLRDRLSESLEGGSPIPQGRISH